MYTEEVSEHETPFPILARVIRTGESVVFKSSAEIPAGIAFNILIRNYEGENPCDCPENVVRGTTMECQPCWDRKRKERM